MNIVYIQSVSKMNTNHEYGDRRQQKQKERKQKIMKLIRFLVSWNEKQELNKNRNW